MALPGLAMNISQCVCPALLWGPHHVKALEMGTLLMTSVSKQAGAAPIAVGSREGAQEK